MLCVCEAGVHFDLVELKRIECDVVQLEWKRYMEQVK